MRSLIKVQAHRGISKFCSLSLIILGLSLPFLGSCEGPQGPAGPAGPQGETGPEGPQGDQGPGARVINLELESFLNKTRIGNFSTYVTGTESEETHWVALYDTALTSVDITESEFVFVYAKTNRVGFKQLPLKIDFVDRQHISLDELTVSNDLSNYDALNHQFETTNAYSRQPAPSLGNSSKHVYGGILGNESYVMITTTNNNSSIQIRTYNPPGSGFDASTTYPQVLYNDDVTDSFPFDNDITNSAEDTYPSTDSNRELDYRQQTDQVSAIKNILGDDLDLVGNQYQILNESTGRDVRQRYLRKNPVNRNLQITTEWNSDSIYVTGMIEGRNIGNDPTAYVNEYPVDIKIVIVSGENQKMKKRIPYEEMKELINN